MADSGKHPLYYTEAKNRGDVEQTRWGTTAGVVGGTAGTIGAAHLIGKHVKVPTEGVKEYFSGLKQLASGKDIAFTTISNAAERMSNSTKTIDEAIGVAKEAVKNGGDDAAKAASKNLRNMRAGKWGAAVVAGLAVGYAVSKAAGAFGKMYGTFKGPSPEQTQSWAAREDARRDAQAHMQHTRC